MVFHHFVFIIITRELQGIKSVILCKYSSALIHIACSMVTGNVVIVQFSADKLRLEVSLLEVWLHSVRLIVVLNSALPPQQ